MENILENANNDFIDNNINNHITFKNMQCPKGEQFDMEIGICLPIL
jgi:hypothetical protein